MASPQDAVELLVPFIPLELIHETLNLGMNLSIFLSKVRKLPVVRGQRDAPQQARQRRRRIWKTWCGAKREIDELRQSMERRALGTRPRIQHTSRWSATGRWHAFHAR